MNTPRIHDLNMPPLPIRTQPPLVVPASRDEHIASALVTVTNMKDELAAARDTIATLRADLGRETDRCVMLDEERRRHRAESLVFRSKLIELATVQSNIGLLTTSSNDIMRTVHELTTGAETPTPAILNEMERAILPPNELQPPHIDPAKDTLEALSLRPSV